MNDAVRKYYEDQKAKCNKNIEFYEEYVDYWKNELVAIECELANAECE